MAIEKYATHAVTSGKSTFYHLLKSECRLNFAGQPCTPTVMDKGAQIQQLEE